MGTSQRVGYPMDGNWTVTTSEGEVKLVENGGAMPIKSGLKIRFTKEGNGEII